MSFFQQPGKDVLVGSSVLFKTVSFSLQWGTSSACLPQDNTFTRHLPEKRSWFVGAKVAVQEQQKRRVQCWARWDVQVSLPSSKILISPLVCDWERIWSYLHALHDNASARLLCPCSLVPCPPGSTLPSCSPLGFSQAGAGDPLSFLVCIQDF